jgi:sugar lactone lactonase YvrE
MANRLIKLRPVSGATSTPEAGDGSAQQVVLPINGLSDGAGVCIDRSENIYVTDFDKHVVYKYRRGSSASMILAGAYGVSGLADGQGSVARFNGPSSICVDRSGRLWIVDSGNNRIRRMDENGNVFTVAAIPATVGGDEIGQIACDDSENLYFIDNTP